VSYVEVFIDPDDGRSPVEQVYAQVRSAIVEGRLAAGDMLTPTRTFAGQLGLSRFTVTEAYGRLVAEGIVEGRRSEGTFVTSDIESPSSAERVSSAMRPRAVVAEMRSFADPARTKPPRFDLRAGRPDLALFPLRAWRRCTTTALQTTPTN
jgi:GntR family transcriptional regulator / MocR family aminotransferase